MGIPFCAYQLLKKHKKLITGDAGAENKKCLMLGRAKMTLTKDQVAEAVLQDNIPSDLLQGWADAFLKYYGFGWVGSMDYSAYEGADYLWNLNIPLVGANGAVGLARSTIDLILDYGTTEHIFNPGMSFWNSSVLLKEGGYLNSVLPLHGFSDHGFYQFSPSFFYALDRPEFRLESLYFVVHNKQAGPLMAWDGLSFDFREHVHGAFDGSFAANCLPLLNEKIIAWALYKKISSIDQNDFLYNTQQAIYQTQWSGPIEDSNSNALKLEIYKLSTEERISKQIEYIKSIAMTNFD